MTEEPNGLRGGLANYGDPGFSQFLRKVFISAMGYSSDALERPIVGITNTSSGYNACHRNVPDMIEAIKRGVLLAGGLPIDFPVVSVHEAFSKPTSMFLRNLMAMDTEEMVRAQPMDSVVLVGGCDKTVPALLMAAASADTPAILTVTGPMSTGTFRGERLGACTDCRRLWASHRAGDIDAESIEEASRHLAPTAGTCMVMGTASTMALMSEAMGIMLPGGSTIPATHGDRLRHAEATGARAVEIARQRIRPSDILTPAALTNALRVLHAIGGSTNGLVHIAAVAGRLGIRLDLDGFDSLAADTPVLVDLKPSGRGYMEDLHAAGGLPRLLHQIRDLLDLDCLSISGRTLGEELDRSGPRWPQDVVRDRSAPVSAEGALRILRGNIAPRGAVIKQSAADPKLMVHTGRAMVFESLQDLDARIDDPDLDVEEGDVLVLRNVGPKGAPGMPEAGSFPVPRKLAAKGVKDMVRLSDARMSGTAFGTIALHICPEAAEGGALALVRTGDRIRLDVPAGRLDLLVSAEEFEARAKALRLPSIGADRGYLKLWHEQVLQADEGCDFAFLKPAATGAVVPLPRHPAAVGETATAAQEGVAAV